MKLKTTQPGYDMYFRASGTRMNKKIPTKKGHAKVHTRKLNASRMFNIPDEQMSEPQVLPKEERRYWH